MDKYIKIILIGESGVGKSSIICTFCDDNYSDYYVSTIGVDFRIKKIIIDNNNIQLKIWDTVGQERFRSITSSYYRGSNIVILVFDLTNRTSFEKINEWMDEINKQMNKNENYMIVLIGNKSDCIRNREISHNEIIHFTQLHKIDYYEVSAKNNNNINLAFFEMTKKLLFNDFYKLNSNIIGKSNLNNFKCCY